MATSTTSTACNVTEQHGIAALDAAVGGPVAEGSVGGGTGMTCYQFKGGSGTSSRLVSYEGTEYVVGVFVQANFSRRGELVLAGLPPGDALAADNPWQSVRRHRPEPAR